MKNYFCKNFFKPIYCSVFCISLISLNADFLNAEYLLKEFQVDDSTKSEEDSSVIPTNPFEIVEMIRKYNSLNNATNPTDAIDNALESFQILEEK